MTKKQNEPELPWDVIPTCVNCNNTGVEQVGDECDPTYTCGVCKGVSAKEQRLVQIPEDQALSGFIGIKRAMIQLGTILEDDLDNQVKATIATLKKFVGEE